MSTAEYMNEMSNIEPTDTPEKRALFEKLHESAKEIHTAEMGEITRFKSIMDKLMAIEIDIHMIKKHFNIVPILGESALKGAVSNQRKELTTKESICDTAPYPTCNGAEGVREWKLKLLLEDLAFMHKEFYQMEQKQERFRRLVNLKKNLNKNY